MENCLIIKKKVSIIIPVCNGAGCIKDTVEEIMRQDYDNKEVIIVENGSTDNTWDIVRDISDKYPCEVIVCQNSIKGTAFARRRGIELASGDYVFFIDADDSLISCNAISSMVKTAIRTEAQIVQFGYFVRTFGLKRFYKCTDKETIVERENLLHERLGEVLGFSKRGFAPSVWSKIYATDILKEITESISLPLIYSEDMYINLLAFTAPNLKHVALVPRGYYIYKNEGLGVTGEQDFAERLFYEYNQLKPLAVKHVKENGGSDDVIDSIHQETLYFFRAIIGEMIYEKMPAAEIISKISEYDKMTFVQSAKSWYAQKENEGEETTFLAGQYTAEEYYEHVRDTYRIGTINVVKRNAKRIIRKIASRNKD